jgi:hypothetical protein
LCEHFGWSYDFLLHGIAWMTVQKMMLDAPSYTGEEEEGEQDLTLTEGKCEQIANYINSLEI